MVKDGAKGKELVVARRNFRKAIFAAKLTANFSKPSNTLR